CALPGPRSRRRSAGRGASSRCARTAGGCPTAPSARTPCWPSASPSACSASSSPSGWCSCASSVTWRARSRGRCRAAARWPVSGTDDPRAAIDAVIFDMDGVLADSEPLHQHAIRLLLAEYGVDWMPDGRDPTVGLTSLESFAIICERHALRHDPRHLDALY